MTIAPRLSRGAPMNEDVDELTITLVALLISVRTDTCKAAPPLAHVFLIHLYH